MISVDLKDEFKVAAEKGDFSSPELKEVQTVLKAHNAEDLTRMSYGQSFNTSVPLRLTSEDTFEVNGRKLVKEQTVSKHKAKEQTLVDALQKCKAVKRANRWDIMQ